MPVFTRTTKNVIIRIDEFFDNIELGLIVFRSAIKAYLEKEMDTFNEQIQKIENLENGADRLQREIENEMITHSILPQHRSEVSTLIDQLDEIIDGMKKSLTEISIELPEIPESLNKSFIGLTDVSVNAAEALIPAARAFFRTPDLVREKLIRVYYYETETDKVAFKIKKIIFQDMPELELARKAHLRYIVHHIENISDIAQKAADLLAGMAIKMIM